MVFRFFIPNLTLDSTAAFNPSHQMFQTRPEAGQRNKIPAVSSRVQQKGLRRKQRHLWETRKQKFWIDEVKHIFSPKINCFSVMPRNTQRMEVCGRCSVCVYLVTGV